MDVVIDSAPNCNEAKILRDYYPKILPQAEVATANNSSCSQIKVSGTCCGFFGYWFGDQSQDQDQDQSQRQRAGAPAPHL